MLSDKQKKWIRKNYKKSSIDLISKKLKVKKDDIEEYIGSLKGIKSPKYFYLILILIPILFFIILEGALNIFGYGFDNNQWINASNGKVLINPDIARRYFYSVKDIPLTIQDTFDKVKKTNSFRVFVMGGSSAAGYPFMPNGSFSRYLQRRLELVYPDRNIEVVNVAMTATNSYTIRDLLPGVLEQKPDLLIIYAGHNEYYGALGAGSLESLGRSRTLVNLMLYLEKYKTVQLLRSFIQWVAGIFTGSPNANSGTLMSRMAKEQKIPLNSEVFNDGIEQFEGNLKDILQMAKDKKVPVIIGTLTSNLKDQPPFISVTGNNLPPANKIYSEAKLELRNRNIHEADSLFKYAKDLDALRFRAPELMNRIIKKLVKEYNDYIVNIDSVFNSISPDSVVGNNLMTDHLHPTLKGYQIIGRLLYNKMEQTNLLPDSKPFIRNNSVQDSLTIKNFYFSKLDTITAVYRIKLLKDDWPYKEKKEQIPLYELIKPQNYTDSLAFDVVKDKISWEKAHRLLAERFLAVKDIESFKKEMNIVIAQYPLIIDYYKIAGNELLKRELYKDAYPYLLKRTELQPDAFSAKWVGIIDLSEKKTDKAIKYLEMSLHYNSKDPQVLFNLAGAYSYKDKYREALQTINKCLEISPHFPEAANLKQQLEQIVNKKD
jgi:lysophospholipase L1-like esterase